MRERKNFMPGVDYEEYRKIQNDLPENQKMRIFVCKADDQPVSVSICTEIGDTGIYLLGATGDRGMNLNGSNLLQWEMLKWLNKQGCRYYDLGGIDPALNPGVYRFKCGVTGKAGQEIRFIGQYIFYSNFLSGLLYKFIEKTKYIRKVFLHFRKINKHL
jgi:lipid II:glycine glycyltransferase (peptidoglycan interpeptide bridge formation enzyme)